MNCLRCLIYTRISKDQFGDGHGVANQLADLDKRALARRWTVVYRLSDNDIGVTRKDPTTAAKRRPGYEEALGGGTLSAILGGWSAAGLSPPQSKAGTWTRSSIREILLNPRNAGLSAYHGEIAGTGTWEPLVGEETWRAVRGILQDPAVVRR